MRFAKGEPFCIYETMVVYCIMTFKARLTTVDAIKLSVDEIKRGRQSNSLRFTKEFIVLPEDFDPLRQGILWMVSGIQGVKDNSKYTLYKLPKFHKERTEHSKFQIQFEEGQKFMLLMNWRQEIKMKITHNRYWVYREREWFIKTIIATSIGATFGVMGAYVGYKIGIQSLKMPTTTIQPNTPQLTGR